MRNATLDAVPDSTCEACGAPAIVHISDVNDGVATMQHFCAACVDAMEQHHSSRRRTRGDAAVIIVVGAMITLMSLLADVLQFGSNAGFGRQQRHGVTICLILLVLGAIARARTLFTIGLAGTILSLLADQFAFGNAEGFGRQQILGSLLGIAMILSGFWWVKRSERR